jgi:hypothetical protein
MRHRTDRVEPDGPHGEMPALKRVLFRAAFRRTPRTSFNVRGSPVIYAVLAGGLPVVDGLVAGMADHEGLALVPGHESRPWGLA